MTSFTMVEGLLASLKCTSTKIIKSIVRPFPLVHVLNLFIIVQVASTLITIQTVFTANRLSRWAYLSCFLIWQLFVYYGHLTY